MLAVQRQGGQADDHHAAAAALTVQLALVIVLRRQPLRHDLGHRIRRAKVAAPDIAAGGRAGPHAAVFVGTLDLEKGGLFGFVGHSRTMGGPWLARQADRSGPR